MRALCAAALALLAAGVVPAQPTKLPVKRVVLYKNGVGYFEHEGRVSGAQEVSISFTSGQLNDVLKSLTVLDLGGGRIAGVTYGSAAPMERRLGELRLAVGENPTLREFLAALRGASVEVRGGQGSAPVTGRVLSVERKVRLVGTNSQEVETLSLLLQGGEVRTMELSPATAVKVLDRDLAGRVDRYLDVLATARQPDTREMRVAAAGAGDRRLFVSYISETPVWKTTYRILLPAKSEDKPRLQGWAIVDNTVGEDWEQVQLSLVAGAPHSFIQALSQPYYTRRPEIGLPEAVSAAPQTHEAAVRMGGAVLMGRVIDVSGAGVPGARVEVQDESGGIAGHATTQPDGSYTVAGLPDGQLRVSFTAAGFGRAAQRVTLVSGQTGRADATLNVGAVSESVEVVAGAEMVQTSSAAVRRGQAGSGRGTGVGRGGGLGSGIAGGPVGGAVYSVASAVPAGAAGLEMGDLFEYRVAEPISIRKNQSALVPIANTAIAAEKVSIWNSQSRGRPQRALWLHNTTPLTLDAGSFSVIEDGAFAGEGIFESIAPEARRLVSYATDLGVLANIQPDSGQQRVTRTVIAKGMMTQQSEVREKRTYTFRNEDKTARTVVVEHPVRGGYELRSEPKPAETTAAWMRFRVQVEPRQSASLTVEEVRPQASNFTISNLSAEQVGLFARAQTITPEVEAALRRVLAQKAVIDGLKEKQDALEKEQERISEGQQRVRENLKALKGSAEERALVQRYTRQLDQQETRLAQIEKESEALDKSLAAEEEKLEKMIEELAADLRF